MKKLLALVMTAVLALGLLSCGGKNESQKESSTPEQTESISVSDILSESANTPKDEAPIAEMEEIKILVDELDAE